MRRSLLALSLLSLGGLLGVMSPTARSAVTLEELRWERRLVVVYGDDASAPLATFERLVTDRACELDERDVDVYRVAGGETRPFSSDARPLSPTAGEALAALAPSSGTAAPDKGAAFGLVLIGKDGGVKRRATTPEALDELLDAIDAMPMRRAEAARRGGSCDG